VKKKLEHELEIAGATLVVGGVLSVVTFSLSEDAAVAVAAGIADAAASLGVAVSEEIAAIASTTLATAAFAGVESVAVNLAVTQPMSIALGEQKGGLSIDEAREAGEDGAITGGLLGGAGSTAQAISRAGGITELLGGCPGASRRSHAGGTRECGGSHPRRPWPADQGRRRTERLAAQQTQGCGQSEVLPSAPCSVSGPRGAGRFSRAAADAEGSVSSGVRSRIHAVRSALQRQAPTGPAELAEMSSPDLRTHGHAAPDNGSGPLPLRAHGIIRPVPDTLIHN
jgi:hypothetical protein